MGLLYADESYNLVGAFFDVYNELGSGFLEAVYQESLSIELNNRNLPCVEQPKLEIKYKGNQVVSGVAINLFASGFTVFMLRVLFNQSGNTPTVPKTATLFGMSIIVFIIYAIAFASHWFIYKTVWGLRMRAVGEHPLAADTVGINVIKVRYSIRIIDIV